VGIHTFTPKGPFDLANQSKYFGGWPTLTDNENAIVIAFPLEDWQTSAAVVISQDAGSKIKLEVYGAHVQEEKAVNQALAILSLDVDGAGWPKVGKRDEQIGELQAKYGFIRPTLFNSPYEAAAHFVIGHRISMKQGQAIQGRMAEAFGAKIEVQDQTFAAFPDPHKLLKISAFPGLNMTKIERLHGIAAAALAGKLDRDYLRRLPIEQALKELDDLNGIGPFFAAGILYRGAGIVDDLTDDDIMKYAVKVGYHLKELPNQAEVLEIAEPWKPYRMWAEVLMQIWLRREVGLPRRR